MRIPSNREDNLNSWTGNLTLTYDTNQRTGLKKTFTSPHSREFLTASQLGLGADEYIREMKVKWDRFNPGDFSIPNYRGPTNPAPNVSIGGNVAKHVADGRLLKGGDPVPLQWTVTGNGKTLYTGTRNTTLASVMYTPIHANLNTA